jgi:CBS domain-containing protein/anti-sigma regulatory factor (Ser/Thr protein kinase)
MDTPVRQKGQIISDQTIKSISRVEELAYELKIKSVMTHKVSTISPDMTMQKVLDILRNGKISGAPVLVDNKIVGVLSIEDVIRCLVKTDLASSVSKYMTPDPVTVKAHDPVIEALKIFVNSNYGRLPVVDENNLLIGIITKGDVTRGLLKALQNETLAEEMRRYRASHLFEDIESDRTSLILRYNIKVHDFNRGGAASGNIKRALLRLGASPQIARRCGIAIYEAEMNLIIHTNNGGKIRIEIEPHQITMIASDDGPGIKDVNLALQPGFSTADEKIRELGFGAGMGLTNIARCTDTMELVSTWGKETKLTMKISLSAEETLANKT